MGHAVEVRDRAFMPNPVRLRLADSALIVVVGQCSKTSSEVLSRYNVVIRHRERRTLPWLRHLRTLARTVLTGRRGPQKLPETERSDQAGRRDPER